MVQGKKLEPYHYTVTNECRFVWEHYTVTYCFIIVQSILVLELCSALWVECKCSIYYYFVLLSVLLLLYLYTAYNCDYVYRILQATLKKSNLPYILQSVCVQWQVCIRFIWLKNGIAP